LTANDRAIRWMKAELVGEQMMAAKLALSLPSPDRDGAAFVEDRRVNIRPKVRSSILPENPGLNSRSLARHRVCHCDRGSRETIRHTRPIIALNTTHAPHSIQLPTQTTAFSGSCYAITHMLRLLRKRA